jgi:hypothetical protein
MEDLVLMFMAVNLLAFSFAVMYHASHADRMWPFERRAARGAAPPAPAEAVPIAEWGDYVHRGLQELTVMLAQAARKRPH